MKAIIKLSLIVLLIAFATTSLGSLLPSLSQTTILNVGEFQAGTEAFKVTYSLITKDTAGTGIVYTPHCFECHLPFNFSYSSSSAPTTINLTISDFSHTINKLSVNDDINVVGVRILTNVTYFENIDNISVSCQDKSTANGTNYTECVHTNNPYQVEKWGWVWKPLTSTITLEKGKWYAVDFIGKRTPTTGAYSTDLIPIINSVSLSNLAWWNTSYEKRLNTTLKVPATSIADFTSSQYVITPVNFTAIFNVSSGDMRGDCLDYSYVNNTGELIAYQFGAYTDSDWGCGGASGMSVYANVSLRSDNTTNITAYYNNPDVTTLSNKSIGAMLFTMANGNTSHIRNSNNETIQMKITSGSRSKVNGIFDSMEDFGASGQMVSVNAGDFNWVQSSGATWFIVFNEKVAKSNGGTLCYGNGGAGSGFAFEDHGSNGYNLLFDGVNHWIGTPTTVWKYVFITANLSHLTFRSYTNTSLEFSNSYSGDIVSTGLNVYLDGDAGCASQENNPIDTFIFYHKALTYDEMNATWTRWARFSDLWVQESELVTGSNETGGRASIEQGIKDSLGSNAVIYTDQQIYTRNITDGQQLDKFDKFTLNGTKRWAFNYINSTESFTNMQNITPTLYVLEMSNLTTSEIRSKVSNFINQTK